MLFEPFEREGNTKEGVCLHCGHTFKYRSNKKFCSDNCRKRNNEGTNNSFLRKTKRRDNAMLFDRAMRLAEGLYTLPPIQRLGFVKDLIDVARQGEDAQLRDILSNYRLLRANPKTETHFFYRGSRDYRTIAQVASNYCKRYWLAEVKDVVYNRVPEPPTGEVVE